MMQKYTLTVADIELSLRSDAAPDEIEHIRGILDRKIREIYLTSRCPKLEAALLCAMDFCAERMALAEKNAELDERCGKYAVVLDNFKDRTADLTAEVERLRNENAVLRTLITAGAPAAPNPIPPTDFLAEVADAQNKTAVIQEPIVETPAEPEVKDAPQSAVDDNGPKGRSRVGSMFDLLSFDEVD